MKGASLSLPLGAFSIAEALSMLRRLYKSFLMAGLRVCGPEGKPARRRRWGPCVWGTSLGISGLHFFIYRAN